MIRSSLFFVCIHYSNIENGIHNTQHSDRYHWNENSDIDPLSKLSEERPLQ